MKTLTLAAMTAALLTPFLAAQTAQAADAPALEVRFCPAAVARTYPLESRRNIQSLVLQNLAVLNHGGQPVELTGIEIELMQAGQALDLRRISGPDLAKVAASGPKLQASGMMKLIGFQFCNGALIPDGVTLAGPALKPNEGLLVSQQPFAWKGARDQVRVTVHGLQAGKPVEATGVLPIRSEMSKTVFRFPLKGTWFAAVGPTPQTAHRWGVMEEFAFDIARIGAENSSHRGAGARFDDFYAYGAEVLAAADGKVVSVLDGVAENPDALKKPGESDETYGERVGQIQMTLMMQGGPAIAGDHVIIDHGNGEYSLYAHLKPGSLKVKPGDMVKAGQPIAQLGSSGNSTEPHLHFQVCDRPDPLNCAGIPINFQGYSLPYADYPRPIQSGDIVVAD